MGLIEGFKHFGGDARVFEHTGADDGDLGDAGVDIHVVIFQDVLVFIEQTGAGHGILVGDGEDNVLALVVAERLNDHIDVDLALGEQIEELIGDARNILQTDQSEAGNLFILRDAGNIGFFHFFDYLLDDGAGIAGKAGEHLELNAVALGKLDGAVVEHLRAHGGKLQHFVIGDLR